MDATQQHPRGPGPLTKCHAPSLQTQIPRKGPWRTQVPDGAAETERGHVYTKIRSRERAH